MTIRSREGTRGPRRYELGAVVAAMMVSAALAAVPATAQIGPEGSGVVEAALTLRRLDGVKRVLMIGAHPDDEDTGLLTAMARGMGIETAYLSLTRGDGGQNLIGPELGEGLGIIRTGELEAARRLDGGRQFFSRAYDYGFSKSADEAFAHWPRDEVLRDIVLVIRTFRPQVIVSVWSGTPQDGHGQHQASGILATEAFEVADDRSRFRNLPGVAGEPWRVDKLFQSVRRSPGPPPIAVPTGTFDPLLGRSYLQLAMESRSQHRSQDMGALQPLGPSDAGLRLVKSRVPTFGGDLGIFAGIDTTLAGLTNRLPDDVGTPMREHLRAYRTAVQDAAESLSALHPERAAAPLAVAYRHLEAIFGLMQDLTDVEPTLAEPLAVRAAQIRWGLMKAASIVVDVRASDDLVTAGQDVDLEVRVWNGGPFRIDRAVITSAGPRENSGGSTEFSGSDGQTLDAQAIESGAMASWSYGVHLDDALPPTRLYYLESQRQGDMYQWSGTNGSESLPRNWRALLSAAGEFDLHVPGINGPVRLVWGSRARYVGVDKASGEYRAPVLATPSLSVGLEPRGMAWPQGSREAREVTVLVRNDSRSGSAGNIALEVPDGWNVTPASIPFNMIVEGSSRGFTFTVEPGGTVDAGAHVFRAVATLDDGQRFDERVDIIDYPHIERTLYFQPAEMQASVLSVRVASGIKVGYVMGSGDDGLQALRQIGVDAEEVSAERVRGGDFTGYDVLVLGIRVYETRPDVAAANDQILEFARAGGTVIVQYNKFEYPRGNFASYPVSMGNRSAPRVTDENSPFVFLDPDSPVFNSPNRITSADFEGWVQERGLYFLSEWDERFTPLLELTDPGEEPTHGSLLVAPVGEGFYAYVGLSFFRQFPAGVPGAYRLFANLVSLTADDWSAAGRR